jgi:phosphocarrier protein
MNDESIGGELCNIATIVNKRGMHARAAAKFVKVASVYVAEVTVVKDEMRVSAKSIMGLMMLAAAIGSTIKICGAGQDAAEAVTALTDLVARKFDEE